MTTQTGDNLIDGTEQFRVKPFPLSQIGGTWHGVEKDNDYQDRFALDSTACWRRYIATWSIVDNKLFLTGIEASDNQGNPLSIFDIFHVEKLPAFWFSGELWSPLGKPIYGMYEPLYEKENVWVFERGELIRRFVLTNEVPNNNSMRASLDKTSNAQVPFEPNLAELLDKIEVDGRFDKLSDRGKDSLEKIVYAAMNNITSIKSWFIPNYDSERDPEYDVLRDAWQHLTHQDDQNAAQERLDRARNRLARNESATAGKKLGN